MVRAATPFAGGGSPNHKVLLVAVMHATAAAAHTVNHLEVGVRCLLRGRDHDGLGSGLVLRLDPQGIGV